MADKGDTVSRTYELCLPIIKLIKKREGITIEDIWEDDDFRDVREQLSEFLTKKGTIGSLAEASNELQRQHRELVRKSDLTPEEIEKMGILSATAYVLSAEAFASLITPKAVFIYTLKEIYPWLELLAKVAIRVTI